MSKLMVNTVKFLVNLVLPGRQGDTATITWEPGAWRRSTHDRTPDELRNRLSLPPRVGAVSTPAIPYPSVLPVGHGSRGKHGARAAFPFVKQLSGFYRDESPQSRCRDSAAR